MRRITGLLVAFAIGLTAAGSTEAAFIVNQSSGQSGNITCQTFPDAPTFSSRVFDDFTITSSFNITAFVVFGTEQGNPSFNSAVTAEIRSTPNVSSAVLLSTTGTQSGGNLNFNFGGALLGPGTYWITSYVTRSFSGGGGQWFVNLRSPVTDSQAVFHNPGGGFGVGTSPVATTVLIGGDPRDIAFTLEGNAVVVATPTPPGFLLGGIGAFCVAMTRLRLRRVTV